MAPHRSFASPWRLACVAGAAAWALGTMPSAWSQGQPVTSQARTMAQQVADKGVPLSDLADGAPDAYTIKSGDTLWAISGLYLKTPWRWPELWGMNLQDIANPHRIFPGQVLRLERKDGRAMLTLASAPASETAAPVDIANVRVSPLARVQPLTDAALPALRSHIIDPFLTDSQIVDANALQAAPRIVATATGRVMLSRGDRAYARGVAGTPLVLGPNGAANDWRVFRDTRPIKDPSTGQILGYEAHYLGRAELVRSEIPAKESDKTSLPTPATLDIVAAKEEMREGDRLLPQPPRSFPNYVPRAPERPVNGLIAAVHGNALSIVGQNQVVLINKGHADGLAPGHVLAVWRDGATALDRGAGGRGQAIRLPHERSGLMMVFRSYEKLSYALVLEITEPVRIGDRFTEPR